MSGSSIMSSGMKTLATYTISPIFWLWKTKAASLYNKAIKVRARLIGQKLTSYHPLTIQLWKACCTLLLLFHLPFTLLHPCSLSRGLNLLLKLRLRVVFGLHLQWVCSLPQFMQTLLKLSRCLMLVHDYLDQSSCSTRCLPLEAIIRSIGWFHKAK